MDSFSKQKSSYRRLTPAEERFNSLTHGFGTLLSVAGLAVLLVNAKARGDIWHLVSFSVFGISMILLYLSSTLYHSFTKPAIKNILARIDHAAIFFLIAGTYTPFLLTSLRGTIGWWLFGIIWLMALTGAVIRTIFLMRFRKLMVWFYLLMGWLFVVAIVPVSRVLPVPGLVYLITGGLFYTVGVIFYVRRDMKYSHGIWHLFVLGGSTSHFFSVLYTLP